MAHNELAAKYDYVLKNFLSTIYRRKKRSITLSEIEAFCTECSQLIQKLDANSQSFHQMHLFAQANHLYTTLTKFKNFLTGVNSLAEKLSKYTSPVGGNKIK